MTRLERAGEDRGFVYFVYETFVSSEYSTTIIATHIRLVKKKVYMLRSVYQQVGTIPLIQSSDLHYGVCLFVICLFVIVLHSASCGHGISHTYFLPASSIR